MASFVNYKLRLKLEAQMPMIHFQSLQHGATLRASEAKPKLDRFILSKLMKQTNKTIAELKKDEKYKRIFLDPESGSEGDGANNALDYKMQILVNSRPQEVDLNAKEYPIFYANSGRGEKLYGLFSDPEVIIYCFIKDLCNLIEENIEKFFLVTNFGTMQNKGFGSFMPADFCKANRLSLKHRREIVSYYRELSSLGTCYAMIFEDGAPTAEMNAERRNEFSKNVSRKIKFFYASMKTGMNLSFQNKGYSRAHIYKYMHKTLGMGNEKAWLKQNGIAPIINDDGRGEHTEFRKDAKYRYVRALLGVGSTIIYKTKEANKTISIKIASKALERVASPVYFKVIRNVVFIVAYEVPKELYGEQFEFIATEITTTKENGVKKEKKRFYGSGRISTPSMEECSPNGKGFDVQAFLDDYVKYYNGEMRKNVQSKDFAEKVVNADA